MKSGNVSAAQTDMVTLRKDLPAGAVSAASTSDNPIAEAFTQLSKGLQSGNLSAAQSDFSTLKQDLQQAAPAIQGSDGGRGHHHHQGGGGGEVRTLLSALSTLATADPSTSTASSTASSVTPSATTSATAAAAQQTYSAAGEAQTLTQMSLSGLSVSA